MLDPFLLLKKDHLHPKRFPAELSIAFQGWQTHCAFSPHVSPHVCYRTVQGTSEQASWSSHSTGGGDKTRVTQESGGRGLRCYLRRGGRGGLSYAVNIWAKTKSGGVGQVSSWDLSIVGDCQSARRLRWARTWRLYGRRLVRPEGPAGQRGVAYSQTAFAEHPAPSQAFLPFSGAGARRTLFHSGAFLQFVIRNVWAQAPLLATHCGMPGVTPPQAMCQPARPLDGVCPQNPL